MGFAFFFVVVLSWVKKDICYEILLESQSRCGRKYASFSMEIVLNADFSRKKYDVVDCFLVILHCFHDAKKQCGGM